MDGVDLEAAIWQVVQGLLAKAKAGDPAAGKLLFDRLCGPLESRHLVAGIQIDTKINSPAAAEEMRQVVRDMASNAFVQHIMMTELAEKTAQQGPPVPTGKAAVEWARDLLKIAEESLAKDEAEADPEPEPEAADVAPQRPLPQAPEAVPPSRPRPRRRVQPHRRWSP